MSHWTNRLSRSCSRSIDIESSSVLHWFSEHNHNHHHRTTIILTSIKSTVLSGMTRSKSSRWGWQFQNFLLLMMIRDTWSACGMRQDNSRFFRSPFLVRCHFQNAGKRIFGGLLTLVLNNGMIWSENKSSQTCSYYLLSYPLYLWSNCGIAKSRNDWE